MSGVATAIGVTGALSVGAGAIEAANRSGGVQQGYDVVQMPQYSFTEPRLRLASDYLTQNINRMSQGQYPAWYDKLSPILRNQMNTNLNQSTFGTPGNRGAGTMGQVAALGAQTGVGPKATWAQGQKAMQDYQNKSQQIDSYLASLGVNIMQGEEGTYLQGMTNIPQGPPSAIVNNMGGVYGNQQNPWQGMANAGQNLANVPWGQLGNQFNNWNLSSGGGTPTGQTMNYGGQNYPVTTNPAYYAGFSGGGGLSSGYQGGFDPATMSTGVGSQGSSGGSF